MRHLVLLACASLLLTGCASASNHQKAAVAKAAPPATKPSATADDQAAAVPTLAHTSISELEKMMAAGDLKAQVELGARYGQGKDVPQSYEKAKELLLPAAQQNDPDAEYLLGVMYYSGFGVPKDEAHGVLW